MTIPQTYHTHIKVAFVLGLPVLWAALLMTLLNATNPLDNGPLSVLTAFVLIYLLIASLLYASAVVITKALGAIGWRSSLAGRKLYYFVSVIALGPVFLLALNTLGRIEIKDIILVILLVALGCFYVSRRGVHK